MKQVTPDDPSVFTDDQLGVAIRTDGETVELSRHPLRGSERTAGFVILAVMASVTVAGGAVGVCGAAYAIGHHRGSELAISLATCLVFWLGALVTAWGFTAAARTVFPSRVCLTRSAHEIVIQDFVRGIRWRTRRVAAPKSVEFYLDRASKGYRCCVAVRGSRRRWFWLIVPIDAGGLEACRRLGGRMADALGRHLGLPVAISESFGRRHKRREPRDP